MYTYEIYTKKKFNYTPHCYIFILCLVYKIHGAIFRFTENNKQDEKKTKILRFANSTKHFLFVHKLNIHVIFGT